MYVRCILGDSLEGRSNPPVEGCYLPLLLHRIILIIMIQAESKTENATPTISSGILEQIAENIEQVVWLRDYDSGEILYISPSFEAVWGRSCESFYANQKVLIESVHPEDRVQVMVTRDHRNDKPFTQVYRIYRPDGNLRWISNRAFLVEDVSKNKHYQVNIAQDITKQNQVDQSLRKALDRSREQFTLSRRMSLTRRPEAVLKTLMSAQELRPALRAALLFFNDPVAGPNHGVELTAAWLSHQDKTAWLSEANLYEEMDFWNLAQSSRTITINSLSTNPRVSTLLRDYLLEGKIQSFVLFPLVTSGIWLGCLVVYFDKDLQFSHMELAHLKVLIDQATITLYNLKLLKNEEELRREAERANAIKTEFLGMISHELRTPLTSIIGFANTLLADDVTWEPQEQREFIQTIQQESFRLQELIDHLLDLSRLEAGRLPIQLNSHFLHEVIQQAMPQLHVLTSNHQFLVHISDTLPPVLVDDKRIAQVVVNLVRNAATYAPQGSEINISANVRGDFIQVNVNDEGPGIPPSERKWVFQAFRRGAAADSGITKGAGLGLAICKGLIEAHGGRIWIKNKSLPGTTVSFTVPLAPKNSLEKFSNKE
jgi:PAS domain S-box-containing protein